MAFLYLKIPTAADAADTHHRVHEALDRALADAGLGTLLGWGASLGEPADGGRPLRFHRIDVEVAELDAARALLQRTLDAIGAAAGAELHYAKDRVAQVDVHDGAAWRTRVAAR